jgi:mono/diheme cytochrome c family protein
MELRRRCFQRGTRWLTVFLLVVLSGCKVRSPGALERTVASQIKRKITVGGRKDQDPLPPTNEIIQEGRRNFSHYCMVCHGLDGQNTGVPFADRMSPPVPELSSREVQAYTDGQLKWIVENGIFPSGMPASKGILNDEEIWSIVHYIRHLPQKGSLGEPRVYNEDQGKYESGQTNMGEDKPKRE